MYTWNTKAKKRSKKRLEYFRKYNISRLKKLGIYRGDRNKPIDKKDSVGMTGEKMALKYFKESKWIGKKIDLEWLNKKIDIKTSKPHLQYNKYPRWKYILARQKGFVDLFVLFGLNDSKQLQAIYVIPDKEINVSNISIQIGTPSKYEKYRILLS